MTKSEIIKKYLGSYETGNRDDIEEILSHDFKFKSPQDDEFGREVYFEKCWPMSEFTAVINIENIIEVKKRHLSFMNVK